MAKTYKKYKGYRIDSWYKQDTCRVDYYEAKPMRYNEVTEIRKEKIERPWHGAECDCVDCKYTKSDLAYNKKIEQKAQIVLTEIRKATFRRSTQKKCKEEIDKREINGQSTR